MKNILTDGLREMGLFPPQGAVEKLCRYAQLLTEQNKVMNLTAIIEPEDIVRLHFLDSAAILTYGDRFGDGGQEDGGATWLSSKSVIDVGTGAGFPGVVLKILEPSLTLTLADSLGKRVNWLETVCGALGLENVTCVHARAEELSLLPEDRDAYDLAVSRAVAAYPALCELCLPFVKVGGGSLAMKSVESDQEVRAGERAVKKLGGKPLPAVDYLIPGTEITHRLIPAQKVLPTPKGLPRSWGKIKKSPL